MSLEPTYGDLPCNADCLGSHVQTLQKTPAACCYIYEPHMLPARMQSCSQAVASLYLSRLAASIVQAHSEPYALPPNLAFPSFSEEMHIIMGQCPKQDECQQEC